MIHLDEEVPGGEVIGAAEHRHVEHRRARHTALLQLDVSSLALQMPERGFEERHQRVTVGAARDAVGEDVRARPFGAADVLHEPRPLILFRAADEERAVGELNDPPGSDAALAEPRGDAPGVGPVHEVHLEVGGDRGLHVDVDVLPRPVRSRAINAPTVASAPCTPP